MTIKTYIVVAQYDIVMECVQDTELIKGFTTIEEANKCLEEAVNKVKKEYEGYYGENITNKAIKTDSDGKKYWSYTDDDFFYAIEIREVDIV